MIRVSGLSKRYGNFPALCELSFEVAAGQVVGLLGPNGAGKSTCLRILAGFMPPSAGSATVGGQDVVRQSLGARRLLGYLPEGAPLDPELRVEEQLGYWARLRRVPPADRRAELERVIALCGLELVVRRLGRQLSRGYRQRLGLARALIGDPPLLILDEPSAGLDPNQARELRQLIQSLAGEHTVLLSSHLLAEVEAVCSALLVLHEGRLVGQGTLAALRRGCGQERLLLRVRGPAAQVRAALAELPGVAQAELLESEPLACLRLTVASPSERLREALVKRLVQGGWALQELRDEAAPLEEIFAGLTASEGEDP